MRGALALCWVRLFFVQAGWNYDRLVGTGVAHALEPLLARLPGGRHGERYQAAMRRAARNFNTHPYFAGLAIGAEARAEHDGLPGHHIERIRRALVGPLGSLGDQIVWAGALPIAIGVGLFLAVEVSAVVGVIVFLALYNAVHLGVRTWALRVGWQRGREVAAALGGRGVRWALAVAAPLAALTLGVALPVSAAWLLRSFDPQARLGAAGVAAVTLVLGRWVLPGLGGTRFGLILGVLAGAVGWLWR